jgi:bifunctional enzyme CysN/CysC
MATGASTADLAIVLVDARKGVLTQTRRHSFIASLLGIRTSCWRSTRSTSSATTPMSSSKITAEYPSFAKDLGFETLAGDPDVGALRRQRHP